ncbi:hypothetical protein BDP55DRAFT_659980 [Colletotrichum godetiae]|uniref:Uncharacterized protein n=1 Tax=Colletotrichum godetiae TaxID=1209918 RepID=A0AAJ0AND5_9PEZI|nr:uncharacterized protein BDP55DRAFT_659980 [Colletotrichum godetiae]KAK1687397.1 hypothetical protein BDP55DRAFT_659980 [Colletotrichum godetiae]
MPPRPRLLDQALRLSSRAPAISTTPLTLIPHTLTHRTVLHTTTMSWMDSWSRPGKSQATPAPFYLLPNGDQTSYCRTCGRVISSRKTTSAAASSKSSSNKVKSETSKSAGEAKYCSSRCRAKKPSRLDKEIEQVFVRFLQGDEEVQNDAKAKTKKTKGDTRILVPCDVVEESFFGERKAPDRVYGRGKNRASRVIPGKEGSSDDEDISIQDRRSYDEDAGEDIIDEMLGLDRSKSAELDPSVQASLSVRSGTRVRPPQTQSQVNGSVGGEKGRAERVEETEEMREKRAEGQRRAHEREMVRCAARRGVVFGFLVGDGEERRKCEAVRQGKVVEPSFAKGEWSIRWRED